MGKARKKKELGPLGEAAIIEGVIRHIPCGWVSDGGAFREGAGCPKCEEPILAVDCEEVTEGELVDEDEDELEDDEDEDDDAEEEEDDLEEVDELEDEDEEDEDEEEE